MKLTFEEYCSEYLDLHLALMSDADIKDAKKSYAALIADAKAQEAKNEKHQKALEKAKESRKLAKFYGGKALVGSAAQKKWAEEIRENVLKSDALTDEQKIELVTFSDAANQAKFWIDNKDNSAELFNTKIIISEFQKIQALYTKYADTLVRERKVYELEKIRKEIYEALCSAQVKFHVEFPNCSFYDAHGNLVKDLKFRC